MKDHPLLFTTEMVKATLDGRKTQTRRVPIERYRNWKVGDKIWVRETWLLNGSANILRMQYKASDSEYRPDDKRWCGRLVSKHAPEHINEAQNMWHKHEKEIKGYDLSWRPSIHMPKWVARIWLEITGLRVENVQDIDAVEAEYEGIRRPKRLCPDRHDEYIGVKVIEFKISHMANERR